MDDSPTLIDTFGRRFCYLRLSVTDICNFRCAYCLPDGQGKTAGAGFLSLDEIRRLVTAFAALGVWKLRLTGGEPTLRADFLEIARACRAVPGITRLCMTTNGYRLPERAADFRAGGIDAINISIDTLDPARFAALTGHDRLEEVLDGVAAALAAGFHPVKVNAVLLRGVNDDQLDGFIDWVRDRPITLRFIELMRTGDNAAYFARHHLPGRALTERLAARGWAARPRAEGDGPAVEYAHPDAAGRVGLIAPYGPEFCASCNRLRVSARGDLHLCLFGQGGLPLRDLLQRDDQCDELCRRLSTLLRGKKASHFLHQGDSGATPHLASIGG